MAQHGHRLWWLLELRLHNSVHNALFSLPCMAAELEYLREVFINPSFLWIKFGDTEMQHFNTTLFFFFPFFYFNYIRKEFSFLSSQKLLQLFLWKNLSMQMLWSRGVKYRNGAVLLSKCLLLSLYKWSQIYSLQISGKKKCNHSSLTQDLLEFSTVGKTLNKYWKLDIRFLKLDTWKRGIPKLGLNLH